VHAGWGLRIVRTLVAVVVAIASVLLAAAGLAHAGAPPPNAAIIVTTTADVVDAGDGETSLREAFTLAEVQSGHDEVVLLPGAVHEIGGCGPDDETFQGSDPAGTTISGGGATVDSTCTGRLLDLDGGPSLVQDVTLTGASDEEVVWIVQGDLVDITFTGLSDDAGDPSSMVVLDDGVAEDVIITDTTGFGALLHLWGTPDAVSVEGAQVRDNEASGGIVAENPVAVADALVSGNDFGPDGAGIVVPQPSSISGTAVVENAGRGVHLIDIGGEGVAELWNTTVAWNSAPDVDGAGIVAEVPVELTQVTVADNHSVALYAHQVVAPQLTSFGSVISSIQSGPLCDVDETTSRGWNASDGSCGLDWPIDLELHHGAAALDPEPTTHGALRPLPASALIDGMPSGSCELDDDQRGVDRPQGPGCDIGAYEVVVPFPDVTGNHPFNEVITWLAEQGIAGGYDDGTYRPAAPVSRGAMAAFVHRFAGDEPVSLPTTASFGDVPLGHPFVEDVEWLVAEGIASGYDDGTYRPAAPVSRAAMAAFLHRLAQLPS
jgi:hypothetical protein